MNNANQLPSSGPQSPSPFLSAGSVYSSPPEPTEENNPFASPESMTQEVPLTRRSLSGFLLLQVWLFAGFFGVVAAILVLLAVWRFFFPQVGAAFWGPGFAFAALTVAGFLGLAIGYTVGIQRTIYLDARIQEVLAKRQKLLEDADREQWRRSQLAKSPRQEAP